MKQKNSPRETPLCSKPSISTCLQPPTVADCIFLRERRGYSGAFTPVLARGSDDLSKKYSRLDSITSRLVSSLVRASSEFTSYLIWSFLNDPSSVHGGRDKNGEISDGNEVCGGGDCDFCAVDGRFLYQVCISSIFLGYIFSSLV